MVGDSGGDSIVASELRIGEIDLRSFGGGGVGDSIRGDRYAAFGPSGQDSGAIGPLCSLHSPSLLDTRCVV